MSISTSKDGLLVKKLGEDAYVCCKNGEYKEVENYCKEGFSLIEMIIVISIIGILAGIIAIKFSGAQETARENADYANAANIATAYYLAENQGKPKDQIDSVEELVNGKYLESSPKVQSIDGQTNFTIDISSGNLLIKAGEKQFYPRNDK